MQANRLNRVGYLLQQAPPLRLSHRIVSDDKAARAYVPIINQCINKPTFRRHTLGFLSERRRESYLEAFAAKAMTISLFVQDLPCW